MEALLGVFNEQDEVSVVSPIFSAVCNQGFSQLILIVATKLKQSFIVGLTWFDHLLEALRRYAPCSSYRVIFEELSSRLCYKISIILYVGK